MLSLQRHKCFQTKWIKREDVADPKTDVFLVFFILLEDVCGFVKMCHDVSEGFSTHKKNPK